MHISFWYRNCHYYLLLIINCIRLGEKICCCVEYMYNTWTVYVLFKLLHWCIQYLLIYTKFLALMKLQKIATDRVQELTNLLQEKIRQFQKLPVWHTFLYNEIFNEQTNQTLGYDLRRTKWHRLENCFSIVIRWKSMWVTKSTAVMPILTGSYD